MAGPPVERSVDTTVPSSLQVTTLSEYRPTHRRGGRSRKVTKLIQIVDKAAANFVTVGEEIANENPDFQVGAVSILVYLLVNIRELSR